MDTETKAAILKEAQELFESLVADMEFIIEEEHPDLSGRRVQLSAKAAVNEFLQKNPDLLFREDDKVVDDAIESEEFNYKLSH